MELSKNKIEKLDRTLQEMALIRFEDFCILAGVDKMQAYVCLERSSGKSYGEIAQSIGVTRQAVSQRCKQCP